MMNTKATKQVGKLSWKALSITEGGNTVYYGNGVYCNKSKGCWVNWSETTNSIITNSAMNWLSGGNAGWHSGGPL